MKTPILIATILLSILFGCQATELAWDDPNPAGFVTKYTLYIKVYSATGGATWQKVKDIPAGQLTTSVPTPTVPTVYAVTAWGQGGLECMAKCEFTLEAPRTMQNLRENTPATPPPNP